MKSWRTVLSYEEPPSKPCDDPEKVKEVIKNVIDEYEMAGEKVRLSNVIRDVASVLKCNYFTPGLGEAVRKELKTRGWSFGNYDEM